MTESSPTGVPPGNATFLPDPAGPGAPAPPDASGPRHVTSQPPAVPALPPVDPTDLGVTAVTGRRVVAALIDLAVLLGLLVILSQIVGPTSADAGGGVRVSMQLITITHNGHSAVDIGLFGRWAVLYAALTVAYYFALEAWAGQTLGKALLGVRVAGRDGGRAGPGAIAGRTVLRAVDGLPLLYLVGYVSVLVTGSRRARLGDLGAGTAVLRARPDAHPARRAVAAAGLIAVLAAAVGLPAYRLTAPVGPQTYREQGVSFAIPAGWQQVPASELKGIGHSTATLTAALALSQQDLIVLEVIPQGPPVTAANFASFQPRFGQAMRQSLAQAGWSAQAGPERITLAGMLAQEAWLSGRTPSRVAVGSVGIYAYRGTTEYHLVCQHTPSNARQVAQACAEVMRTLTVAGVTPQAAGGAPATPLRFKADAQTVCQQAMRHMPQAPPRQPSPAQLAAAFSHLATATGTLLTGFATVETPAAWQYPFGEFLAHTGQLYDAASKIARDVRGSDLAGARQQWRAAQAAISQIRRDSPWLSSHGLAACTALSRFS
jgi:uncharacterized RDD family membrane protein YckC